MSIQIRVIAATALVIASGCGGEEELGAGSTPASLVGSWYAGRGGTIVPYNPTTGAFGRPNGQGLVYIFDAGGRYRKAFQSYASNGGCTNGFTAHEEGTLTGEGGSLYLHPTQGKMIVEDTCAPSLGSTKPLSSLADESFTWELRPSDTDPSQTVLWLQRSDGAASSFRRL